jgi:hypothetical protein
MDTADRVLLQLADPTTRPEVLDADALLQLAVTCYAVDPTAVTGPTTAVYDRFDLAVASPVETSLSARLMRAGDALPWDVAAAWDTGRPPTPGADAVMTGSLVVRAAGVGGLIEAVDVTEASATGSHTATLDVRLQLSAPPNGAGAPPLLLPVVIAFLVDDGTSPRDLLRATAVARRVARTYAAPSPPDDAPARRADGAVCWVVPAVAFADDGWPGGPTADDRLAAARAWLGEQGVAVVVT